jgi:LuxR family maltose regulon positive regulatory protein
LIDKKHTKSNPENEDHLMILQTKLHAPVIYSDQIFRDKIIDKLETNIEKRASLISAPAGYGKSQTAAQWIERSSAKSAWISLDEEHNDLRVFLGYFIATIKNVFPNILAETTLLLSAGELPPVRRIAYTIINELDAIEDNFILVLDDYHKIKEKEIHDLLNEILSYPPQNLHISIVTRKDPPLNLNNHFVNRRMIEVRMGDLAFSEEEISLLFKKILNVDLEKSTSTT